MLVLQKTMFDCCYCIKSFCRLNTLENASKSSIFVLHNNGAKNMKGSYVLKTPVPEQRRISSSADVTKLCSFLRIRKVKKSRASSVRELPD